MLETSMGEKSQRVQKAHRSQACQPDRTTVVRKGELLITANGSSNLRTAGVYEKPRRGHL